MALVTKTEFDEFNKLLGPRIAGSLKDTMIVHEGNKAIFKDNKGNIKLSMLWDDYLKIKATVDSK